MKKPSQEWIIAYLSVTMANYFDGMTEKYEPHAKIILNALLEADLIQTAPQVKSHDEDQRDKADAVKKAEEAKRRHEALIKAINSVDWNKTDKEASPRVEAAAKAVCEASFQEWPGTDYNGSTQRRFYRSVAKAALDAAERVGDSTETADLFVIEFIGKSPEAIARGHIYNDRRKRFSDGEIIRTTFIQNFIPPNVIVTKNSTYRVLGSEVPESVYRSIEE